MIIEEQLHSRRNGHQKFQVKHLDRMGKQEEKCKFSYFLTAGRVKYFFKNLKFCSNHYFSTGHPNLKGRLEFQKNLQNETPQDRPFSVYWHQRILKQKIHGKFLFIVGIKTGIINVIFIEIGLVQLIFVLKNRLFRYQCVTNSNRYKTYFTTASYVSVGILQFFKNFGYSLVMHLLCYKSNI